MTDKNATEATAQPAGDVPARPALRIVGGNPGPAEIAAVTAVLAAISAAGAEADAGLPAGGWADLSARLRPMPAAGPGAWRNSVR